MHGSGWVRLSRWTLQVIPLLFLSLLVSLLAAFGLWLKEPGHLSCRVSRLSLRALKGELPPPRVQALPVEGNGLAPEDSSK